jgi:hypothetical protein
MRNRLLSIGIVSACCLLLYPSPAHAYLDMGTGSMILQGLVASLAGVAVFLRLFRQRLKNFLFRGGKAGPDASSGQDKENG